MLKEHDGFFEGKLLIPDGSSFFKNVRRSISMGAVAGAVAVAIITKLIITGQVSLINIIGLICSMIGLFMSRKAFIKGTRTRIDDPNSCIILVLKKKKISKVKKPMKKPMKKLKFALKRQKLVRRSY
ncbi:hypothetical protein RCL_jg2770.t1 [Rhizophagus clarus]|uniref:Uncharacterized protein n=1 Tax=Rhizophagus clarus TaxID=94130 RepID=A0A8H3MB97_9GLOM|nr:hypothetical protein RCL_jg2770.t1 [Rhizophagus clarus]